MLRSTAILSLLVSLAACPKRETSSLTSTNDCFEPSSATVKVLNPGETDPEVLGNLRAVVIHRCTEDGWSADAKACIAKAQAQDELQACWYKHLAQAQQDKLNRAAALLAIRSPEQQPGRGFGVSGIEPAKGDAAGGSKVVIRGTRFISEGARNAKVLFGGRAGVVIRFTSDTELLVEAPYGKEGETVDVVVTFEPGGTFTLPRAFTFAAAADLGPQ